jgi:hypothetical protein
MWGKEIKKIRETAWRDAEKAEKDQDMLALFLDLVDLSREINYQHRRRAKM